MFTLTRWLTALFGYFLLISQVTTKMSLPPGSFFVSHAGPRLPQQPELPCSLQYPFHRVYLSAWQMPVFLSVSPLDTNVGKAEDMSNLTPMCLQYLTLVLVCWGFYRRIPWNRRLINNINLFFTVLKGGKSKIKAPSNSASGESPLPGS